MESGRKDARCDVEVQQSSTLVASSDSIEPRNSVDGMPSRVEHVALTTLVCGSWTRLLDVEAGAETPDAAGRWSGTMGEPVDVAGTAVAAADVGEPEDMRRSW